MPHSGGQGCPLGDELTPPFEALDSEGRWWCHSRVQEMTRVPKTEVGVIAKLNRGE